MPSARHAAPPARAAARCCEGGKEAAPDPVPEPDSSAAPAGRTSEGWSGAGRFTDDEPLPLSFWLLGSNPRRAILPTFLIWGVIAPAVNLWGAGSFLLSLAPDAARAQRLDAFYPVSERPRYPYAAGGRAGFLSPDYAPGFKRYVDAAGPAGGARYEFRFPATYVQDSAVYLRQADAAFERRSMDPTLAAAPGRAPPRRAQRSGPEVAFGPAGGAGEENLSVVTGPLVPGFTLRGTLGPPEAAARRLLELTIAKEGVREPALLGAKARASARSGLLLYEFEYRVDDPTGARPPTFAVCVVGASRDTLFTFASRAPAAAWAERADQLREAAASFELAA